MGRLSWAAVSTSFTARPALVSPGSRYPGRLANICHLICTRLNLANLLTYVHDNEIPHQPNDHP